ncbi:ATP-binding protein [Scytonema sp. UIC 10036]|uniref:ATP-binding protein n=1 Tax=Scytonema sp. UIC 10036 TaxID=2304196 RepID=UPI00325BC3E4
MFLPCFDRFRKQMAGSPETKRIGAGLAIVRYLVEMHGGSVRRKSGIGQGATFTVRLPSFTRKDMCKKGNEERRGKQTFPCPTLQHRT